MTPEERREALVEATLPLLYQHGRDVTTRLIAEAAGVAEGTIFRVFDSKDELIDEALAKAFESGQFAARIAELDSDLELRELLLRFTSIMQQRLRATFGLMRAMGMFGPPSVGDRDERQATSRQIHERMVALVEPHRDELGVEPAMLIHTLRLLTFAGSHEQISDGRLLTPDEIVDTLLHGVLRREN